MYQIDPNSWVLNSLLNTWRKNKQKQRETHIENELFGRVGWSHHLCTHIIDQQGTRNAASWAVPLAQVSAPTPAVWEAHFSRPGWLIGWLWLAGVWTRKDGVVYYISSLKVPYAMGDGHVLLDFVHKRKYSQLKVFLQSRSQFFPSFRDDWGVIRVIVPGNSCWNHQTVLVWLLSRPLKNDGCSAVAGPPGWLLATPSQPVGFWQGEVSQLHDTNINRYVYIVILE